jgi:hypothetical protein
VRYAQQQHENAALGRQVVHATFLTTATSRYCGLLAPLYLK